jgi:hypothetical protein
MRMTAEDSTAALTAEDLAAVEADSTVAIA